MLTLPIWCTLPCNKLEARFLSVSRLRSAYKETSPHYVVPGADDEPTDQSPDGPDDHPDDGRVIDREVEDFERFVNDLEKLSAMTESPGVRGKAVFDYFDKLEDQPPILDQAYRRAMGQVLPLLFDDKHRVEVIVWATTPAPSALERAGRQSFQIARELADLGRLNEAQKSRLTTTAKVWIDAKAKRPVLSVITRKLGPAK